jgi:hypothetical protein
MYTYEDLSDLAHAKEERRGRLVSRIRGWLRKERSPRRSVALLLIPTAAWVVGVDVLLYRLGLDMSPLRWAMAILGAWPLFVLLLRWRAAMEWRHLDLSRVGLEYVRYDQGEEARLAAPKTKRQMDNESAFWDGFSRGMGQAQGGAGLPLGLLLGAVTLGTWTIWKLIRNAPGLLTDVIIDGDAVPSTPSLATKIPCENWFCEALAETYPYFLSLAFAAFVVGVSLPFFSMLAAYAHAHPHHSVAFLHFMVSNGPCTV